MSESRAIGRDPDGCEKCGSSDGKTLYDDGHTHCYVCNHQNQPNRDREGVSLESIIPKAKPQNTGRPVTPLTTVFRAIPRRGLPEEAIRKYGIDINMDRNKDVAHRYPYFKNGVHVANKVRKRSEKTFYYEGNYKEIDQLFGENVFPPACARALTIVEGELDAASAYVLQGSRYPVVSVKASSTAVEDCTASFEYLNAFDDIVVCFDKDEAKHRPDGSVFFPGQEAAKKVAELFAPGKCRILTLQHGKDPNEYLVKGIPHKTFVDEWWKAPKYMPDGLIFGYDLLDEILNSPTPFCVATPIEGLNHMTYGFRLGEMWTLNAEPKVGKTEILKWFEYTLLNNPTLKEMKYGVGFMHLEEPKKDTGVGILGFHLGKRLNLPDTVSTPEEITQAFHEVLDTDRVVIWDHFGSNSVDAVVNKIRHMHALGCKYIVIDHFSMLASDQASDERKKLDEIATKLKTLTVELNICLIGVVHQNRQGFIRGTMAFEQLSNIVVRLDRNKEDSDAWRRNVMVMTVTDNRFSGRSGPCAHLFYDDTAGTFTELDDETSAKYDEGKTINDSDMPWA